MILSPRKNQGMPLRHYRRIVELHPASPSGRTDGGGWGRHGYGGGWVGVGMAAGGGERAALRLVYLV